MGYPVNTHEVIWRPPTKYRNAHAKHMDVGMRPLGTGGGLEIAVFNPLSLPQLIFSQDSRSGFDPTSN